VTWVGSPVPQVDIVDKLTGRLRYADDMALVDGLVGVIVRSPIAHGRIRNIDTAAARAVPGVRAVITAADLPEVSFGPYTPDWEVLARHKVRYVGDEVVAIAADSLAIAQQAAALVRLDLEPLPTLFDPFAATEPGAPVIWDERPDNVANRFEIHRGDVDAAFASAHHVVEATHETSRIYHGYLEPISVIGTYQDDGVFDLVVPTHVPYKARLCYSAGLGVPTSKIRIRIPPIGGSFGAKYEMTLPMIAGTLSRVAGGAPVRITLDREQDAANNHPRPPFHFRHRIAVAADGRFIGREIAVRGIAGARTFWSPTVLATAVHRVDSLYDFQAMRGSGELVYLNESPTTCMRGFGNAEALYGIEQMIDQVARELDLDPLELRLRNATKEGERTMHGWFVSSSKVRECARRVDEVSGHSARRHRDVEVATRGSGVRRGIGMSLGHHVSGYKLILADFDGSSALVSIGIDGVPVLSVGEPDIGQGLTTILCQIVADGVGVRPDEVSARPIDSFASPASVGTLASRAATMSGMAVVMAVEDLQRRLLDHAAQAAGVDAAACTWRDGGIELPDGTFVTALDAAAAAVRFRQGLPVIGEGVFRPDTEWPDAEKYGNPSVAYPFCAHVAEVEVDTGTGQVRVVGYWAVHDSGTIFNPATARSQVVGAVAQGIGWALLENMVLDDGVMRGPNLLDYRIPGAGDVPDVHVEFVDGYEPNGPLGAKSLGEAAINPVVAAISNAIYDAVGIRCDTLPMTPERVWDRLAAPVLAEVHQ